MDPRYYINRELSMLDYYERVIAQAGDVRHSPVERLGFLGISGALLDEFYMVRVAAILAGEKGEGGELVGPDGLSRDQQLSAIATRMPEIVAAQMEHLKTLWPLLPQMGVQVGDPQRADAVAEKLAEKMAQPVDIRPGKPPRSPLVSNLSLGIMVVFRRKGEERFARLSIPPTLPRWVESDDGICAIEDVVCAHLPTFMPGVDIVGSYPFRVTRSSEVKPPKGKILTADKLYRRKWGPAVRVEVTDMPTDLRAILISEIEGSPFDPFIVEGGTMLGLAGIAKLPLTRPEPIRASRPTLPGPLLDAIAGRDRMFTYPLDSFHDTVERFFDEAIECDEVSATIYRTSAATHIVESLCMAAQAGKRVRVLIDAQARFDEAENIGWARQLIEAGADVTFGSDKYKTHAKLGLIRRGKDRFALVSTGNFNARTALLYTDIALFTADPDIVDDVGALFDSMFRKDYPDMSLVPQRLLVSPVDLRQQLLALIDREMRHAATGKPARVVVKVNALVDPGMIDALYAASRSGVGVDVFCRGMCALRAGVPGLSERIRVVSLVGSVLEHSRFFYVLNGGDPVYYIGSADWMPRNLDRRVEALVPVGDPELQRRLDLMIETWSTDDRRGWVLRPDGTWRAPAGLGLGQAQGDPWAILVDEEGGHQAVQK